MIEVIRLNVGWLIMSSQSEFSIKEYEIIREIALTASFMALVFLSTSLFYISLVSSSGFFNFGEVFVYIAALVGGPIVGALAGGIGSAMADIALGYGGYAPGTLILKGFEGLVAGYLYKNFKIKGDKYRSILLSFITVFLIGFSVYVTTPFLNGVSGSSVIGGSFVLFGLNLEEGISLDNLSNLVTYSEISFEIIGVFLILVALMLSIVMWYIGLRLKDKGNMALSCLLAGPIIIVGYFLYQIFIFPQKPFGEALSEVPFNIAQVVFGTVIAVPIVSYLRELGIIQSLKDNSSNEIANEK
jgi:uncharacterized membrane protein